MESFPKWKPSYLTRKNSGAEEFRIRYQALRNSSNYFVGRKKVREKVFEKYEGKCYLCGKRNNLQVDHIVSVYRYAKERIVPIDGLNSEENLAVICRECNAGKLL